ncbi:Mating-type switching protein swi10 [Tolypocladium ophioglossoides CBS 100239]|uniref:Mating-type switching protein swi10 n=1 Tax=Tolypocladium ophioglossoides (strain CBS 100239) TaxID=1163406 RepID=A0A0L0N3H3_TOLOC|nr:Mating-type switching protein swi10 [Tolypocladium ophioglossoides CBS 100239]
MRNSMSLEIPRSLGTGAASPALTYTPSSQKRRSFVSVPDSLKPGRGRLQRFWPGAKSPTVGPEFKDCSKSDLSTVIRLAGLQMGALGNPANAMLPERVDSKWNDFAESHAPDNYTEGMAVSAPRRAPPPPPVQAPPPMPSPMRAPPPPPIAEPSPVNDRRNEEHMYTPTYSASRARPISTFSRRAKTPVHKVGQLERAARQKDAGINRTSSVSTIARQYRELVEYPDVSDIPDVPPIDPKYTQQGLSKAEREAVELHFPDESRKSGLSEPPRRRSRLTPSLVSDDGTLVAFEEDVIYPKPLSFLSPVTPPPKQQGLAGAENEVQAPATLRFQVGLELLTRELSSAFANQSSRESSNASGLQVWVMIEAYERLRDQIAASGMENKEVKGAIDSWLEALYAIHRNMADEAAGSESEFDTRCRDIGTAKMDDDYGADDALLAAMAAADPGPAARRTIQQPAPQKISQPTPQRLDKAPPANSSGSRVVQPTPQALPQRQTVSSILVSPRQRGNPVLTCIRSMPWEYSDIPADYVLGLTTCALFLSLKYHRVHPEYIYTRIRNLQGKYNLRVLLTMVDIPNHEDSLRELSKTSLVNNVTVILCWSAAETARYLELYKSYENANYAAIRGQQSSSYADKLVDFVTVPRSLNKSDAVALVANFGSLKNAINAEAEQLGTLNGWGGVKVKRWSAAIDEPFRAKKAAKRSLQTSGTGRQGESGSKNTERVSRLEQAVPLSRVPLRDMPSLGTSSRQAPAQSASDQGTPSEAVPKQFRFLDDVDDVDDEEAALAAAVELSRRTAQPGGGGPSQPGRTSEADDALSGGVAAALAKLRENG